MLKLTFNLRPSSSSDTFKGSHIPPAFLLLGLRHQMKCTAIGETSHPPFLHIVHISIFSVFTNGEKCVQYSRSDILVASSIMDDNAPFHRQMGNSPLLQDFFCLHPTDEYSQVLFCSHLWITQQK